MCCMLFQSIIHSCTPCFDWSQTLYWLSRNIGTQRGCVNLNSQEKNGSFFFFISITLWLHQEIGTKMVTDIISGKPNRRLCLQSVEVLRYGHRHVHEDQDVSLNETSNP